MTNRMELPAPRGSPAAHEGVDAAAGRAITHGAPAHDVEEGLACKGTVIESVTFKVQGKAFLFLRPEKAMLRLDRSHDEAATLAAKKPACYKVGSGVGSRLAPPVRKISP
jgi:hypothetical protein